MIELLVAIFIVAILASLLLVGISQAMQSARNIHCRSNLKQLGLALNLYVQDHAEYPLWHTEDLELSPRRTPGNAEWFGHYWPESLVRYAGNALRTVERPGESRLEVSGVFGCPAERRRDLALLPLYGYNIAGVSNLEGIPLGLGGNRPLDSKNFGYARATLESEVVAPAQMMAVADGLERGPNKEVYPSPGGIYAINRYPGSWAPYMDPIVKSGSGWRRHNRRANVVFCDGHVEGVKLESLFFSRDPAALRLWNRDHQPHPVQF